MVGGMVIVLANHKQLVFSPQIMLKLEFSLHLLKSKKKIKNWKLLILKKTLIIKKIGSIKSFKKYKKALCKVIIIKELLDIK